MATKKITEFDTHSIAAADYLLFSKVKNFRIYGTLFYAPEVTMD